MTNFTQSSLEQEKIKLFELQKELKYWIDLLNRFNNKKFSSSPLDLREKFSTARIKLLKEKISEIESKIAEFEATEKV
jgi:hypothetical protein